MPALNYFSMPRNSSHFSQKKIPLLLIASVLVVGTQTVLARGQQPGEEIPAAVGPTFQVKVPHPDTALKIVAYGDCRFTTTANIKDTNPRVRKFLVDQIAKENPDAVFITGDLPFSGANNDDWAEYHNETAAWRTERLHLYPALGNHEVRGSWTVGRENYFANFPELHKYPFYSVQVGNVYLMTLDSTQTIDAGSPQRVWLESQMTHLPRQTQFVFVMQHMPLMADLQSQVLISLPNGEGITLRKYLEAQAPHLPAKIVVLNGHIHNYERFEQGGITYVITGGGGAEPYPVVMRGDQDKYKDAPLINYHYLVFSIHGKHGTATMYRVADPTAATLSVEPKDTFSVDRP